MNANINFSAAQRQAIAQLIKAALASSAAEPLHVPTKKTPLMNEAKAAGFGHREAIAVADLIIAAFEKRAATEQTKIEAQREAERERERRFNSAIKALYAAQESFMQITTRDELKSALEKADLNPKKADIDRAQCVHLCTQIRDAYASTYRTCVNGVIKMFWNSKNLTKGRPASAGFAQDERREYIYRGRFKDWAATIVDTKIVVATDYYSRVSAHGIAFVEGRLVLDAKKLKSKDVELFEAVWLEQGRGNTVRRTNGFIAKSNDTLRAGDSIESAARRLRAAMKKAA